MVSILIFRAHCLGRVSQFFVQTLVLISCLANTLRPGNMQMLTGSRSFVNQLVCGYMNLSGLTRTYSKLCRL